MGKSPKELRPEVNGPYQTSLDDQTAKKPV